ncbi:hypothetical protein BDQ17DRAFT_1420440 [Cyathus striatus]|nr:hypothetical protein BDQ17DRAFT_1420440 [Cyathus striatus]
MPPQSKAHKARMLNLKYGNSNKKDQKSSGLTPENSVNSTEVVQETSTSPIASQVGENSNTDMIRGELGDGDGLDTVGIDAEQSECESESDDSDFEDEMAELTALETFTRTLTAAQQAAEEAEGKRRRELAQKGFPSVAAFFLRLHQDIQQRNPETTVEEGDEVDPMEQTGGKDEIPGGNESELSPDEQDYIPKPPPYAENKAETSLEVTEPSEDNSPVVSVEAVEPWQTVEEMLDVL